eukprot:TRINITY_DN8124_c0_g1_i2.p1 TRINITY_DN8124_c0_g1~~TRINITY_DN8124_c0_g1_i2.p1  ORF type:complete len:571 (-),score=98.67 TRINITY_DN8124_c0_g1_i2:292-2004(-)
MDVGNENLTFSDLLAALHEKYEHDLAEARRLWTQAAKADHPTALDSATCENGHQQDLESVGHAAVDLAFAPPGIEPGGLNTGTAKSLEGADCLRRAFGPPGIEPGGLNTSTAHGWEGADNLRRASRYAGHIDTAQIIVKSGSAGSAEPASCLARLVQSSAFDACSAALVISNSFFIGVQVEFAAAKRTDLSIEIIDYTFCFLFIIELLLRCASSGCRKYLFHKDQSRWNLFDVFIVGLSTLDQIIAASTQDQSPMNNIAVLRIFRILRIMRVLRIIRILKFFSDLRILIASIVGTLKTASFAFILLAAIVYMFSIAITQVVVEYVNEKHALGKEVENDSQLQMFWTSIPRSALTLFMTVSGGIDWRDAADPLLEVSWLGFLCYLVYVIFMALCIMNVITGIFCQSAIETAQGDQDNVIKYQLQDKRKYIGTLQELFASWDDDSDGRVSKEEFESHLYDLKAQALLSSLQIEAHDALTLYEMLDTDGKGNINVDDFVTACITMRGGAKAVHMEKITNMTTNFSASLQSIEDFLKQSQAQNVSILKRAVSFDNSRHGGTHVREDTDDSQLAL